MSDTATFFLSSNNNSMHQLKAVCLLTYRFRLRQCEYKKKKYKYSKDEKVLKKEIKNSFDSFC